MVCKKSLYCLKYGPCADDETRKEIWQENIKIREHFKATNQSDHYWSFQVVGNACCCCDGPRRPLHRKSSFGSLQALDRIDCTSVTHGRDRRGPPTPCPLHRSPPHRNPPERLHRDAATETNAKSCVDKSVGFGPPPPQQQLSLASEFAMPSSYLNKESGNQCPRYKRTLTNNHRERYTSQPNLSNFNDQDDVDIGVRERDRKPRGCAPLSRTTRRSLQPPKSIPFLPFGCNNSTDDMATKRTHNVLARHEVFPSALSAKQQRQHNIRKLMQNEEHLNRTMQSGCFKKRGVNHSSLWTTEYNRSFRDTTADLNSSVTQGMAAGGRAGTPMPRNMLQPVRPIRRPSSQVCFY